MLSFIKRNLPSTSRHEISLLHGEKPRSRRDKEREGTRPRHERWEMEMLATPSWSSPGVVRRSRFPWLLFLSCLYFCFIWLNVLLLYYVKYRLYLLYISIIAFWSGKLRLCARSEISEDKWRVEPCRTCCLARCSLRVVQHYLTVASCERCGGQHILVIGVWHHVRHLLKLEISRHTLKTSRSFMVIK